jgi:malonyl CoA-acyl carrier protein transacylase
MPQYSQPLATAVQIALVDLLASFGITPEVVIGHSSGEIAAAYVSSTFWSANEFNKTSQIRVGWAITGVRLQGVLLPRSLGWKAKRDKRIISRRHVVY